MKARRRYFAAAVPVLALGAGLAAGSPAHAAPARVTAVTHVSNRPDNGHGTPAVWAYDSFARTLTVAVAVHQNPADTVNHLTDYTATITDKGGFTTVGGAGTPNQSIVPGAKIAHNGVKGTLNGTYSLAVVAPAADTLTGIVPALENDNFAAPTVSTTDWPSLAFASKTGVVVTGGAYEWDYATACEKWTDSSANGDGNQVSDGNIAGRICATPPPAHLPFVYGGHVVKEDNNTATVGWSESKTGWPDPSSKCEEVQIFGYGFSPNGDPHIGFTCDHNGSSTNLGYLRGLAAGHTYALRVQPAVGTYGNHRPIPGTNATAHITVVTTR